MRGKRLEEMGEGKKQELGLPDQGMVLWRGSTCPLATLTVGPRMAGQI